MIDVRTPKADNVWYKVNTIYQSIQGEGKYTGVPMTIVRLQGCGVGCVFCDTKETWSASMRTSRVTLADIDDDPSAWALAPAREIVAYIKAHAPPIPNSAAWILLTGGEPGEQDIGELISAFHIEGWRVCIESSGTGRYIATTPLSTNDWLCVSPKIDKPGGLRIIPEVVKMADEIKWVVGKQSDVDKLLAFIREYGIAMLTPTTHLFRKRVSVQPISQDVQATRICLEACKQYGFYLSLQLHKYIGVP